MSKGVDKLTVKYFDDKKHWYRDGVLHRDGAPAVECADGSTGWYKNGELHRDDGPAMESASDRYWYKNGELHRDDGPAIESAIFGNSWYKNGKQFYPCDAVLEDSVTLKNDILEMFETLLDIIYQKTDHSKEWETGTECTTIGEMTDWARVLLKKARQGKQKKPVLSGEALYDFLVSEMVWVK